MPRKRRIVIVAAAIVANEVLWPVATTRIAALGSPVHHYAYSPADMLRAAANITWATAFAWFVALLVIGADVARTDGAAARTGHGRARGQGDSGRAREVARVAARAIVPLTAAIALRAAAFILWAVPGLLAITVAADPSLVAATPFAPALGPFATPAIYAAAALALVTGACTWLRLAAVEVAAVELAAARRCPPSTAAHDGDTAARSAAESDARSSCPFASGPDETTGPLAASWRATATAPWRALAAMGLAWGVAVFESIGAGTSPPAISTSPPAISTSPPAISMSPPVETRLLTAQRAEMTWSATAPSASSLARPHPWLAAAPLVSWAPASAFLRPAPPVSLRDWTWAATRWCALLLYLRLQASALPGPREPAPAEKPHGRVPSEV